MCTAILKKRVSNIPFNFDMDRIGLRLKYGGTYFSLTLRNRNHLYREEAVLPTYREYEYIYIPWNYFVNQQYIELKIRVRNSKKTFLKKQKKKN